MKFTLYRFDLLVITDTVVIVQPLFFIWQPPPAPYFSTARSAGSPIEEFEVEG